MSQPQVHPSIDFDCLVDATNENCPMPLLRAKMQLNKMQAGQTLKLIATDPGSKRDVRAFVSLTSHELIDFENSQSSQFTYYITKRD